MSPTPAADLFHHFRVELNAGEKPLFRGGERVNGSVKINLKRDATIQEIRIQFKGRSVRKDAKKGHETEKIFFDKDFVLLDRPPGNSNAGNFQWKADYEYSLPFEYLLPLGCPTSFEGPDGFVRYFARVTFQTCDSHMPIYVSKRHFSVYDLETMSAIDPKYQEPFTHRHVFSSGGCCCKRQIYLELIMPKRVFYAGEDIEAKLLIDNITDERVANDIQYNIVERITKPEIDESEALKQPARVVKSGKINGDEVEKHSSYIKINSLRFPTAAPASLPNAVALSLLPKDKSTPQLSPDDQASRLLDHPSVISQSRKEPIFRVHYAIQILLGKLLVEIPFALRPVDSEDVRNAIKTHVFDTVEFVDANTTATLNRTDADSPKPVDHYPEPDESDKIFVSDAEYSFVPMVPVYKVRPADIIEYSWPTLGTYEGNKLVWHPEKQMTKEDRKRAKDAQKAAQAEQKHRIAEEKKAAAAQRKAQKQQKPRKIEAKVDEEQHKLTVEVGSVEPSVSEEKPEPSVATETVTEKKTKKQLKEEEHQRKLAAKQAVKDAKEAEKAAKEAEKAAKEEAKRQKIEEKERKKREAEQAKLDKKNAAAKKKEKKEKKPEPVEETAAVESQPVPAEPQPIVETIVVETIQITASPAEEEETAKEEPVAEVSAEAAVEEPKKEDKKAKAAEAKRIKEEEKKAKAEAAKQEKIRQKEESKRLKEEKKAAAVEKKRLEKEKKEQEKLAKEQEKLAKKQKKEKPVEEEPHPAASIVVVDENNPPAGPSGDVIHENIVVREEMTVINSDGTTTVTVTTSEQHDGEEVVTSTETHVVEPTPEIKEEPSPVPEPTPSPEPIQPKEEVVTNGHSENGTKAHVGENGDVDGVIHENGGTQHHDEDDVPPLKKHSADPLPAEA